MAINDPAQRLPVEIFLRIIEEATVSQPGERFWLEINLTLDLTNVSAVWRRIILSSPTLWRNITLCYDDQLDDKLTLALHLSKTAPLHLRVVCPLATWPRIYGTFLSPHLLRISKLTFVNSREPSTYCRISGRSSVRPLAKVQRVQLREETLKFITNFSDAKTAMGPSSILRELQSMKKLKSIQFGGLQTLANNGQVVEDEGYLSSLIGLDTGWISYNQYGKPSLQLLCCAAASLVHLQLQMSIIDFGPLLPLLHLFRQLRSVTLTLEVSLAQRFIPPLEEVRSCQATSLSIFLRASIAYPFPYIADTKAESSLGSISASLHQVFGYLRNLTLGGGRFPFPWSIVHPDGFKILKSLTMSGSSTAFHPQNSSYFPPQLETLTLLNLKSGLRRYQSSTVTSLSLSSNERFESRPQILDCGLWPALRQLSLDISPVVYWEGGQLKNLRTLTLRGGSSTAWDYASEFCRDLAQNSFAMPVIDTINFGHPPEWDLLFILLEYYNFRPYTGSSRISTLKFSSNVPSDLWAPLKELCMGKIAARPQNIALSWIGNLDIICDLSLSGCMRCHKYLLYCRRLPPERPMAPKKPFGTPSFRDIRDLPMDLDTLFEPEASPYSDMATGRILTISNVSVMIPAYPSNVKEILATWEAREEAWQNILYKIRDRTCGEFYTDGRVCIQG
ncbi:hypothetical protein FRC19_000487 [Serendipita sp. 401]|nr:hypothetical protein FRC19_000487 [Serendipita sp. 401]KAG9057413.1 hypothetical protein FS842_006891 [Serendipita sp. 407]